MNFSFNKTETEAKFHISIVKLVLNVSFIFYRTNQEIVFLCKNNMALHSKGNRKQSIKKNEYGMLKAMPFYKI